MKKQLLFVAVLAISFLVQSSNRPFVTFSDRPGLFAPRTGNQDFNITVGFVAAYIASGAIYDGVSQFCGVSNDQNSIVDDVARKMCVGSAMLASLKVSARNSELECKAQGFEVLAFATLLVHTGWKLAYKKYGAKKNSNI
jgi:hypothetical protein